MFHRYQSVREARICWRNLVRNICRVHYSPFTKVICYRIYDPEPSPVPISPGALPPNSDRPAKIPGSLPTETKHDGRQRFANTPIYEQLTTNVPDIAMSFTDLKFPYGPFVPHWIPRQYIENYFSYHQADDCLVLNTTVEEVRKIKSDRWRLVLRKYDAAREIDIWWQEDFDALVIANGHYSVPFVSTSLPRHDYTNSSLDTSRKRPRGIHQSVSRSSRALQSLSDTPPLHRSASSSDWKLCEWARCRHATPSLQIM